ncbi:MAG TPA: PRTRC system protein B [Telluria sp.]
MKKSNGRSVVVLSPDDTQLELSSAMLMYRSRANQVYATVHPIEVDAERPFARSLGAGVPLTKEALAEFARAIDVATAYAGFVPDNLLYTSPNTIAWWTPAAIRPTWFKTGNNAAAEHIGNRQGPAAHPALVFVVTSGGWYVFALKHSERPVAETALYHSPHMNVWKGGGICTGNVDLPPAVSASAIGEYEAAFFRSHFTHPNRERAVKYRGGMVALWRDQLANPDPDSMNRALIPAKETLTAAIRRITRDPN